MDQALIYTRYQLLQVSTRISAVPLKNSSANETLPLTTDDYVIWLFKSRIVAVPLPDEHDLFSLWPELTWRERVTVPLKAGDCTFHHGVCPHMATPNFTDEARFAHIVIFMDAATTYTGAKHVITDPLELAIGAPLDGPLFPRAGAAQHKGERTVTLARR